MGRKRNEQCDAEVFTNGKTVGIYAPNELSAEGADALCDQLEAENPGSKADWHRYAGRVVIKMLFEEDERREYERLKAKFG